MKKIRKTAALLWNNFGFIAKILIRFILLKVLLKDKEK